MSSRAVDAATRNIRGVVREWDVDPRLVALCGDHGVWSGSDGCLHPGKSPHFVLRGIPNRECQPPRPRDGILVAESGSCSSS